jgi:hypothetical protein
VKNGIFQNIFKKFHLVAMETGYVRKWPKSGHSDHCSDCIFTVYGQGIQIFSIYIKINVTYEKNQ